MSGNVTESGDDPLVPGSYSQLLFGNEIPDFETDGSFDFASSYSPDHNINDNINNNNNNNNSPKMLCFGDYAKQSNVKASVETAKYTGQKSGPACKDNTSLPISNIKKRNGPGIQNHGSHSEGPTTGSQRNSKKPKSDNSTASGHAKVVRKEKLGDRITALQQLVSPFGKTDTSSVLHEALGYIRFLHDQVQVLCSPYLQRWSTSSQVPRHPDDGEIKESERRKKDLINRGLCLVPVELTLHVADSNGADLWSSGAMVDTVLMS